MTAGLADGLAAGPRRVVITGIGAVTTLGIGIGDSVAAWTRGAAACRQALPAPAAGEHPQVAAVPPFDARPFFSTPKALKLCDRRSKLAVVAAAMAMRDAGLTVGGAGGAGGAGAEQGNPGAGADIGVILGTSSSDPGAEDLAKPLAGDVEERAATDILFFAERILSRLHPLWLLVQLPNMASAHVAIQLGLQGPNSTVMTDWAAGAQAIGEAYRWIQAGEAAAVLAGGSDTGATQLTQMSYRQAGRFTGVPGDAGDSGRAARSGHSSAGPTSPTADSLLAEGAAVFVLEEREHAIARGAAPLAEIVGYAAAGASASRPPAGGNPHQRAARLAAAESGWDAASSAATEVFDPSARMGHALAAQAPIALALTLTLPPAAADGDGGRFLCLAEGLLGQAVALAIERRPCGRRWQPTEAPATQATFQAEAR